MRFLAFMNIGAQELIVVLLIVLLLFGAKKLPQLARGLRQAVKEFQKSNDEFSDELHKAGKRDTDVATPNVKPAHSAVAWTENQPATTEVRPDPNRATASGDKADQV
jgi:sec-independent protein translocase protein TatA